MKRSRDPDHFDRLYASTPDPWNMAESSYEAAKYRHTLEVLGDRRFAAGLEVGCSIGVLTRQLAERCDTLLAIDIVEQPLQAAGARCAGLPHVRFQRMRAPHEWPSETFDLVVLSEVLYFLSIEDIKACARRILACTRPAAILLLVNWLGRTDDPTTGDEAATVLIDAVGPTFRVESADRTDRYRIDKLVRGE